MKVQLAAQLSPTSVISVQLALFVLDFWGVWLVLAFLANCHCLLCPLIHSSAPHAKQQNLDLDVIPERSADKTNLLLLLNVLFCLAGTVTVDVPAHKKVKS